MLPLFCMVENFNFEGIVILQFYHSRSVLQTFNIHFILYLQEIVDKAQRADPTLRCLKGIAFKFIIFLKPEGLIPNITYQPTLIFTSVNSIFKIIILFSYHSRSVLQTFISILDSKRCLLDIILRSRSFRPVHHYNKPAH